MHFSLSAQNCFESENLSFVNDCGHCVYENDEFANHCSDLENVCSNDTLFLYLEHSLALTTSDSLPEIIRAQIEADFCADGGNIIDCYCTLLPELEIFLFEHTFYQNETDNNSQVLDITNFEEDYLRIVVAVDDHTEEGTLTYEIELEREIIMNCYLCNDQFCIDENIGIPFLEKVEIPIDIKDCSTEENLTTNIDLLEASLAVYPNPASDHLFIPEFEGNTEILLFDASGKMVIQLENVQTLNVSDLSSGRYFIQFKTQGQIYQSTFVKL